MSSESCGTRCVQFILFMLNFIFFLCGIGLIVVAVFVWVGPIEGAFDTNILDLTIILGNPFLEAGCFIMLAAGILIIVFSIIGCCGAFVLSRCLLGVYFFIIIVLFFAQLAGAVLAAVYSAQINEFVATQFLKDLKENYKYDNGSYSTAVDKFQKEFECCGVISEGDYDDLNNPDGIPGSCCKEDVIRCMMPMPYDTGCRQAMEELLMRYSTVIGASLVGVACLELFLMVFSVVLCRNASEKDDY